MSDLTYYYDKGKRDWRKAEAFLKKLQEDSTSDNDKEDDEIFERAHSRFYQPPHGDVSNRSQEQENQRDAYDEGFYQ